MTSSTFTVWGLTATLAVERDDQFEAALATLWRHLDAVDLAANRFRSDSEVTRLNHAAGEPLEVSATFEDVLAAALECARWTDGLCDPTVLAALLDLGYDRDYDELRATGARARRAARPAPGVAAIDWDRAGHRVALRDGAQVDFGASAKALVADRVADEVAVGGGVVVEIGGDVAVRGRGPDGPWAIGVTDSLVITGREERVALAGGGIATSSNATRTWRAGGAVVNHLVDPRTGECADGPFATASVASTSCLRANALATAALLWGEDAPYHLAQAGAAARLVRVDGTVEYVGGWTREGADR
ncbi:MAG TPA: FAD:protein FMN transferase [Acidimicrobiales bacterium]|nr:FAD:protein FMN transferase [Acidimicrobiales bacterium]